MSLLNVILSVSDITLVYETPWYTKNTTLYQCSLVTVHRGTALLALSLFQNSASGLCAFQTIM